MSENFSLPLASIPRILLWGARGEKFFLKSKGKFNSRIEFRLNQIEHGGFCPTFGIVPTHVTAQIIIPATSLGVMAAITGLPMHDFSLPRVLGMSAVMITHFLRVKPNEVRSSGSGGWAKKKKQIKFYSTGLALGLAFNVIGAIKEKETKQPVSMPYAMGNDIQDIPALPIPMPIASSDAHLHRQWSIADHQTLQTFRQARVSENDIRFSLALHSPSLPIHKKMIKRHHILK